MFSANNDNFIFIFNPYVIYSFLPVLGGKGGKGPPSSSSCVDRGVFWCLVNNSEVFSAALLKIAFLKFRQFLSIFSLLIVLI
jgi:hypothetical protein